MNRSWSRLLAGHCGVVSLGERDSRFKELPSQVAAVVPGGSRDDGGWNASDWLTKDVCLIEMGGLWEEQQAN